MYDKWSLEVLYKGFDDEKFQQDLKKVDELKIELQATGIRLYVNVNNPAARQLYETCGYREDGQAYFMEKD